MQTFNVEGMTCAHCERAVINAIQAHDANAKVDVDLGTGVVQVDGCLDDAMDVFTEAEIGPDYLTGGLCGPSYT